MAQQMPLSDSDLQFGCQAWRTRACHDYVHCIFFFLQKLFFFIQKTRRHRRVQLKDAEMIIPAEMVAFDSKPTRRTKKLYPRHSVSHEKKLFFVENGKLFFVEKNFFRRKWQTFFRRKKTFFRRKKTFFVEKKTFFVEKKTFFVENGKLLGTRFFCCR
jgi:hypothetical protein